MHQDIVHDITGNTNCHSPEQQLRHQQNQHHQQQQQHHLIIENRHNHNSHDDDKDNDAKSQSELTITTTPSLCNSSTFQVGNALHLKSNEHDNVGRNKSNRQNGTVYIVSSANSKTGTSTYTRHVVSSSSPRRMMSQINTSSPRSRRSTVDDDAIVAVSTSSNVNLRNNDVSGNRS